MLIELVKNKASIDKIKLNREGSGSGDVHYTREVVFTHFEMIIKLDANSNTLGDKGVSLPTQRRRKRFVRRHFCISCT